MTAYRMPPCLLDCGFCFVVNVGLNCLLHRPDFRRDVRLLWLMIDRHRCNPRHRMYSGHNCGEAVAADVADGLFEIVVHSVGWPFGPTKATSRLGFFGDNAWPNASVSFAMA